ncbi:flagellin [Oscillospiraceae bacterium 21-37]
MRIQHNILAMNAYRNYNTNTSALAKNLEKLSSGYKINRAGDDAAGLAISEKMRAQITGLNAAQKNVKDGISLVKTAEGAMQEIQDMLNRMKYLATQSANGTYQDEVDRENLQAEVDKLCTEIDRIADSANFNGIKLLDGSMEAGAAGKRATIDANAAVNQVETSTVSASVAPTFRVSLDGVRVVASASGTVTLNFKIGNASFSAKATGVKKGDILKGTDFSFVAGSGTIAGKITIAISSSGVVSYTGSTASTAFSAATGTKLTEILNSDFEITFVASGGTFSTISGANNIYNHKAEAITTGKVKNPGQVAQAEFKLTEEMLQDGGQITIGTNTYKIDYKSATSNSTTLGLKDFVKDGKLDFTNNQNAIADALTKAASGNTMFKVSHTSDGTIRITQTEAHHAAAESKGQTMYTEPDVLKYINIQGAAGRSGALQLQIGDTADTYNQMMVNIKDMHIASLGINGLNISDAQKSVLPAKKPLSRPLTPTMGITA